MNANNDNQKDVILHALHQTWQGAVGSSLRRASDDDLLRLLSEVESHLDDADEAADLAFADAPDWDDLNAAELSALAFQYERQLTGGTSSNATPVHAPVRRRHRHTPAQLSFEELESRYSPSTFSAVSHIRATYAPSWNARWSFADERPAVSAWEAAAPATVTVHGEVLDHVLSDFDAELPATALSHFAMAQVA